MSKSTKDLPWLVVSDGRGQYCRRSGNLPGGDGHLATGSTQAKRSDPDAVRSDLFELPGRVPIGYDPKKRRFIEVPEYEGVQVCAVAAFMAPAMCNVIAVPTKRCPMRRVCHFIAIRR